MQKIKKGRSSTLRGSQVCGAQQTLFYRCRQSGNSATEASFAEADAQGAKLAGGLRQWKRAGLMCPPPAGSFLVLCEPAVQTARENGADREPEGKRRTAAQSARVPCAKLRGSCAPVCTWLMQLPSVSYQRMLSKKECFTVSKCVIFKTSILLVLLVVLTSQDVRRVMDKFLLFLGRYFDNL